MNAECNMTNAKIFYYFFKMFRRKAAAFFFFSICLSAAQAALFAVLYPFISFSLNQSVSGNDAGLILGYTAKIIYMAPFSDPFVCASAVLIALAVIMALLRYLSFSSALNLAYTINYNLQSQLYTKALYSDVGYFINARQGDIIFQIKEPPLKTGYIIRESAVLVREMFMALFFLLIMLSINIKLTALVAAAGAAFGIIIKCISAKVARKSGAAMVSALADEDVVLAESIAGIRTIKAYLVEQKWSAAFMNKVREYIRYAKRTNMMTEIPLFALESLMIVIIASSAVVFKKLHPVSFNGFMPLFTVYALSILRIIPSFTKISSSAMNIATLFRNMEVCYQMLRKDTAKIKNGSRMFQGLTAEIAFKNISFTYPGSDNRIFKGLSLSFKKNQISAIVGRTGSGKTTLLNLLLRFYDPQEGAIEADGVNLKEMDRASWLVKIGYVSQDSFIFHATIAENIGITGGYSREEIKEAAECAGIHHFIAGLKDGYETEVGERGMRLSGGERQRIAIARALLKKPEILIFDEATSAVDSVTEKIIQQAIQKAAHSCAVIVVAHRFSTVRIADKILVFDNGRLVEEGSHGDLLKSGSHYSRLYIDG